MALATITEYKAWRGIETTAWDTLLTLLVATATAEIERLTGRTAGGFESATFTEVFDGDGSQTLQVANGPIASITSITSGNSNPTTLEATGYTHDSDRCIMLIPFDAGGGIRSDDFGVSLPLASRSPSFVPGYQNVTVVYVAGYATIPADLKMVCYRFVDHYMDSRGRDFEKVSEAIGNTNTTVRSSDEFTARMLVYLSTWRALR